MCGIFGWVGGPLDRDLLVRATDIMVHRGPDSSGYWSDDEAFLGHRRLKIIELSELGAQPMPNEDGTVLVCFNGEIYNYTDLRADLEAKGHTFRSKSDTEAIIHCYEEYGDACVDRLWGMFAFAIWDQKRRKLFAARDRFGKKPFNYIHKNGKFAFASEIPALLETGLSDRRVDQEAMSFFWLLDYIPAPWTGFQDIRKLPAGHAMSLENGQLRTWQYYPPRSVEPFTGTYDEAREQLRSLMADATRRRLVSDVPVGIALSGGIDSACVVAAARSITPGKLVTVTVRPHTDNSSHDEGEFARATAERFGTEHIEIRPEPDFRESFECIVRNMGEPFAISSAIPCYYLFQTLRQHVTVVISGDGGDETFAGYGHYQEMASHERMRRFLPASLNRFAYAIADTAYSTLPVLKNQLKGVCAGLQVLNREPWTFPKSVYRALLTGDTSRRWFDTRPLNEQSRWLNGLFDDADPMRRQMLTEQFQRMTYHILSKVDITSMAHAVEVRSPLLDHRMAEFARSLPSDFLIRNNVGKWILRDAYSDQLPAKVLGKPKSGFGIPIRELFQTSLRGYLMERLASKEGAYGELVNTQSVPALIDAHVRGKPHFTRLLLQLLSMRLWLENTGARV